jgi:glucokinase
MKMHTSQVILAGDIGGTKTLLQLAEIQGSRPRILHSQRFVSAEFAEFNHLLGAFMQHIQKQIGTLPIASACFGIAGPVTGSRAQVTNLPWLLNTADIEKQFGIARVTLINDFTAVGYSIDVLEHNDLVCLQQGEAVPQATRAVIGAGTGLGEGFLVWQNGAYVPMPSEGGHVDFAPQNEAQIGLLKFLQHRHGHVSYERIVSGSGLVAIYEYLVSTQKYSANSALINSEDAAASIADAALQQRDVVAVEALKMFVNIYGAQAGNLALTTLSRGGVYIAGGIAPKILSFMQQGEFLKAFQAKGRFTELMQKIPVHVIVNADAGLIGARRVAVDAIKRA